MRKRKEDTAWVCGHSCKAKYILGGALSGKQKGTVKVAQMGANTYNGNGDGSGFGFHVSKSSSGKGDTDRKGYPYARGHNDEKCISSYRAVDCADSDYYHHGICHRYAHQKRAVCCHAVSEYRLDNGLVQGCTPDGVLNARMESSAT